LGETRLVHSSFPFLADPFEPASSDATSRRGYCPKTQEWRWLARRLVHRLVRRTPRGEGGSLWRRRIPREERFWENTMGFGVGIRFEMSASLQYRTYRSQGMRPILNGLVSVQESPTKRKRSCFFGAMNLSIE
jgi:hypothetical protein